MMKHVVKYSKLADHAADESQTSMPLINIMMIIITLFSLIWLVNSWLTVVDVCLISLFHHINNSQQLTTT